MAVLKNNARSRLSNSIERWRENIGEGFVSRAMHQAAIQEHSAKVVQLEVNDKSELRYEVIEMLSS